MNQNKFALALLAACLAGCGSELSNRNPLLAPLPTPVPTPVLCPGTPQVFDDFSGGSLANPGTYGDTGSSVANSVSAGAWHMVVTSVGWGAGSNIESSSGPKNASCKTTLKFDIKSSAAGSYTVRFRENGSAATENDENWASATLALPVGAVFTTVSVPVAGMTEDPYGTPSCGGNCQNAGHGNNVRDTTAILKFEISYSTALSAASVDIDNIRYE